MEHGLYLGWIAARAIGDACARGHRQLDPLRDQGRAYAVALIQQGVPVIFREVASNIHGFLNLARGIPSSAGDIAGALVALRALIGEAEAGRVKAQAAG